MKSIVYAGLVVVLIAVSGALALNLCALLHTSRSLRFRQRKASCAATRAFPLVQSAHSVRQQRDREIFIAGDAGSWHCQTSACSRLCPHDNKVTSDQRG